MAGGIEDDEDHILVYPAYCLLADASPVYPLGTDADSVVGYFVGDFPDPVRIAAHGVLFRMRVIIRFDPVKKRGPGYEFRGE